MVDRMGAPLANSIGFPTDTGLTIASLIGGGTAEACPELRIAFSHGGGTFPSMLPRLVNSWSGAWNEEHGGGGTGAAVFSRSPADYARRFYYDTLVFDARLIRYLVDMIGTKQLLIGSDYPYMQREQPVGKTLRSMDLPTSDIEDITWNNAFRFLGVEASVHS
jgi:aminocarboxymuconate-semialdehyde decarboxylase